MLFKRGPPKMFGKLSPLSSGEVPLLVFTSWKAEEGETLPRNPPQRKKNGVEGGHYESPFDLVLGNVLLPSGLPQLGSPKRWLWARSQRLPLLRQRKTGPLGLT